MSATASRDRIIAIPMGYLAEFRRNPADAMIRYGSEPQRAHSPWFTNVSAIDRAMCLPDQVCGPRAELLDPENEWRSVVAGKDIERMLEALSPHFRSADDSLWHVHVDFALNKDRHGDAAGLAMARISDSYEERGSSPGMRGYVRMVRTYDVPLVMQLIAPLSDQIYLGGVGRFVLALKQVLGFNITSFSADQFQSADVMQQLMEAGMMMPGLAINDQTGEVEGLPRPWSVDGASSQPYTELLQAVNEGRLRLPKYAILRRELRGLEKIAPGYAPDHQENSSKDTADAVAGAVGFLAANGHQRVERPGEQLIDGQQLREQYGISGAPPLTVEEMAPSDFVDLDA